MTITRLLQSGYEMYADRFYYTTDVSTAASYLNGGVDSSITAVSIGVLVEGFYYTLTSAIAQCKLHVDVFIPSDGPSGSDTPSIITLASGTLATKALTIYYDSGSWQVYAGATQLGSFTDTMRFKRWVNIGLDFKIDASSGWCYVYQDGQAVLSYTGQTNQGASNFDLVCLGPDAAGDNWADTSYLDNFYLDESTGEVSPACPLLSRFKMVQPAGNGNYSEWVGSDGNSVNNYLLVDDNNLSGGTTIMSDYVEGTTSGDQDSYAVDDPNAASLYAGMTSQTEIPAVSHCSVGQEDTGTAEQFRPFLRYSGTDLTGTAVDLDTARDGVRERFTSPPGGGSWTYAIITATEVGIEVV